MKEITFRDEILAQTKILLKQCKDVLSTLPPVFFLGAGAQFISLAARQKYWESIQTGDNNLGWISNLEDVGWLLKHQREVNRFSTYCRCVEDLQAKGAPIDVIIQECSCHDPEVQMGSSLILSEGMRKLFQWLAQG